jgi:methylenetetrahydrofolate reductase (NADPH)
MQAVRDILAAARDAGRPSLSFELFPTKTPDGEATLFDRTVPALKGGAAWDFCSVTYGAGGGTRDKTLDIVQRVQEQHGLTAVSHLTCVNSTREQIAGFLDEAASRNIHNVLALRGDPPGGGAFEPTPGGFTYSSELVRFIRERGGFSIGVAGFPEGHIACTEGAAVDWDRTADKIAQGADFLITQLFFDNADFYRFRDHLAARGVNIPLLPGMLPILSASQIKRFTALCGAKIPPAMLARIEELGDDDEAVTQYGIEYAAEQCRDLLANGVSGLHFYSLNKSRSTLGVLDALGLGRA